MTQTHRIKSVKCNRCTMTFAVGSPKTTAAETTRCAEKCCKLPFWHAGTADQKVRVGVERQNLHYLVGEV